MALTLEEKWNLLSEVDKYKVQLEVGIVDPLQYFDFIHNKTAGMISHSRKSIFKNKPKELRQFTATEIESLRGIKRGTLARKAKDMGWDVDGKTTYTLGQLNEITTELGKEDSSYNRGKDQDHNRFTFMLLIANYKGGVGKTTTSVNYSHYMALQGYKVLLVDLDSQGSSTYMFGINPLSDIKDPYNDTLYNILTQPSTPEVLKSLNIRKTYWENIDLIPAHQILYGHEFEKDDAELEPHNKIKYAYDQGLFDEYDIVIFDVPPAFSNSTINAIWASHGMFMPAFPSPLTLWSLSEYYQMISDSLRKMINISGQVMNINFCRILPTLYSKMRADESTMQDLQDMRDVHHDMVLPIEMYRKKGISEAAAFFSTVYEMGNLEIGNTSYEARKKLNPIFKEMEKHIIRAWDNVLYPEKIDLEETINRYLKESV